MREELLSYYQRELTYLRQLCAEYAREYPKIASRLQLEENRCEDPHVERLIEAFALIAARVHLKLDDGFPQITQSLLNVVYPHYVRPIPSATIVQFGADPEGGKQTAALEVPRHTTLFSKPVDGMPCKFRSVYETSVWPLEVIDARFVPPDRLDPPIKGADAVAALRVELKCFQDVTFEKLEIDKLRFYLHGEGSTVHALYELLLNNVDEIVARDPDPGSRVQATPLPPRAVQPVGFDPDDALLPYPRRSFAPYRLLQEYFAFPEKFLFVDIGPLDVLAEMGLKDTVELIFLISPFERAERQDMLEAAVGAQTIRLGCSPAVNLFEHTADPVSVQQTRYEYEVVADSRRRDKMEIFSVDSVLALDPVSRGQVPCEPFYSFRHRSGTEDKIYYQLHRSSPLLRREGSDVEISLVDHLGKPRLTNFETLTVRCTCLNANLPSKLAFGDAKGDFETEGETAARRIVALHKPTRSIPPPMGGEALWRLISHLSLNYLSLVEDGKEALQELLRLYQYSDSSDIKRQINGILKVSSRRGFSRVSSDYGISYVRGVQVEIELDEDQFVGGGVYLFGNILERFLGQYVTLNSFSQLTLRTRQRGQEPVRKWQPRAGNRILL